MHLFAKGNRFCSFTTEVIKISQGTPKQLVSMTQIDSPNFTAPEVSECFSCLPQEPVQPTFPHIPPQAGVEIWMGREEALFSSFTEV